MFLTDGGFGNVYKLCEHFASVHPEQEFDETVVLRILELKVVQSTIIYNDVDFGGAIVGFA